MDSVGRTILLLVVVALAAVAAYQHNILWGTVAVGGFVGLLFTSGRPQ